LTFSLMCAWNSIFILFLLVLSYRDSGSKLCRLGLASTLKIGQTFPGIVLSSESPIYASPADFDLVQNHGISGINCSWNR
jgi:pre-rRNA-processing protein TSR3